MKLKSTVSVLCVTGLLAAALTGCGSSASSSASTAGSASGSGASSAADLSEGSTVTGRVQQVTGDSLTLTVRVGQGGDWGKGGPSKPDGGQASGSGSASSSQSTSAQKPAQQPQNSSGTSSAASGAAQSGKGGGKSFDQDGKAPGGQTVTVKLSDSTVVKVKGTSGESDGAVEDITEGAMVTVTMGADTTAATVVVERSAPSGADSGSGSGSSQNQTASSGTGTTASGSSSSAKG